MSKVMHRGTNGVCDRNGYLSPSNKTAEVALNDSTPLPAVSDGSATLKPAKDGRTEDGKFAPGNKLGKGNPFTRKLGAKRAAFVDAVTNEEVAALARELYRLALEGDLQAAALFLNYAVGKPTEAVDPDAVDLDEWKRLYAGPTATQLAYASLLLCDPGAAAEFVKRQNLEDLASLTKKAAVANNSGGLAHHALKESNARVGP